MKPANPSRALIYIEELNAGSTADVFGSFLVRDVPPGIYTRCLDDMGYQKVEKTIPVEERVTAEIVLKLVAAAINLKDVTINAQQDQNLSSISGLDLKLRPVNNAQDLLRLVPGLFIAQHQGGGKAEQFF